MAADTTTTQSNGSSLTTEGHAPLCRQLPIETWTQILSYRTRSSQMSHLWSTFRTTSRLLRAAIEDAFRSTYLPKTTIHMAYTPPNFPHHTFPTDFPFLFAFARLDPTDRTRAIFASAPSPPSLQDLTAYGKTIIPTPQPEDWQHEIRLRGLANGTSLPGFRVEGGYEISVDWVRMYDDLFGEDVLAARLRNRWARDNMHRARELRAPGSVAHPAMMAGDAVKDAFRRARRRRIAAWYARTGCGHAEGRLSVSATALAELDRVVALRQAYMNSMGADGVEEDDLYWWEMVASGEAVEDEAGLVHRIPWVQNIAW